MSTVAAKVAENIIKGTCMATNVRGAESASDRLLSKSSLDSVSRCFQCKKCSCGCPLGFCMDTLPHQVMRLVQLGSEHEVLSINTHWICSSCQTCTTRCPNDIDIAGVMDEIRQQASRQRTVSERTLELFHRLFLREVRRHGRLHELSVIAKYKLLSGQFFTDIPMGVGMLLRRKLKLVPKRIARPREMRGLYGKDSKI